MDKIGKEKGTEEIRFRTGRRGQMIGTWKDGRVAFPNRSGHIPKNGDIWKCAYVGENAKGSVVWVHLIELIESGASPHEELIEERV